jgi:hypothetical protein
MWIYRIFTRNFSGNQSHLTNHESDTFGIFYHLWPFDHSVMAK